MFLKILPYAGSGVRLVGTLSVPKILYHWEPYNLYYPYMYCLLCVYVYPVSSQLIYMLLLLLCVLALAASAYSWIFVTKLNPLQARSGSSCLLADLRNLQLLFCWTYSLCFVWFLLFSFLLLLLMYFPPLL